MPIVPRSIPRMIIGMVLKKDPWPKDPSRIKARSRTAKISGGPKRVAKSANRGARIIKPTMLRFPPMKDPQAEMKRAAPPRPFWVILYPSTQVMTEADSPGMFIRIEVVDPPYMAP
jgi:hypothetical protein